VGKHITWGNDPLGPCGLVAINKCGHWWAYRFTLSRERMYDLTEFNLGVACGFCVAACQAATRVQARGTATRVN
jgi:hypothetical protein